MATKISERMIQYFVLYNYYSCYDDGGIGHDTSVGSSSISIDVSTDIEARLAAQDLARAYSKKAKGCHCHPGPSYVTGVFKKIYEKTEDGFERREEVTLKLPKIEKCPCGKTYTPLRGEKACHELKEV